MDTRYEGWLQSFLQAHGAVAGSVHLVEGDELRLAAAVNIPDKVLAVTQRIPRGKGMAGLALERNEPVSTCNLKTDDSGDVRPGAKAVDAKAAVALPVHGADGKVRATVGLAWMDERPLSDEDCARYAQAAEALP